jgi:hypothetical protein
MSARSRRSRRVTAGMARRRIWRTPGHRLGACADYGRKQRPHTWLIIDLDTCPATDLAGLTAMSPTNLPAIGEHAQEMAAHALPRPGQGALVFAEELQQQIEQFGQN